MKRFAFSLERMLNFQIQNLDKEKQILGRLTAEMEQARTMRDKLEQKLFLIREEMDKKQREGVTIFILRGYFSVLESGKEQLAEADRQLEIMRAGIEEQRQTVTEASKEVKKLEKLKEKQLEEYRRSEAKEQQDAIIEHVAGEFARRGGS